MKHIQSGFRFTLVIAALTIFSACTTPTQNTTSTKPAFPPAAPINVPQQSAPHATALNEGINLYDQGDFNGAIKKLSSSSEIWSSDKATQMSALKYMAFSYCVTSRQTLCRQQFEKVLQLDPAFDLAPGEKMHPLWTPSFDQAKRNVLKGATSASVKRVGKHRKTIVIRKPAQ